MMYHHQRGKRKRTIGKRWSNTLTRQQRCRRKTVWEKAGRIFWFMLDTAKSVGRNLRIVAHSWTLCWLDTCEPV